MPEAVFDAGVVLEELEGARVGRVPGRETAESVAPGAERIGDAANDIEKGEAVEMECARGTPALSSGRRAWPTGARTLFFVVVSVALAIMAFLVWKTRHFGLGSEGQGREKRAERVERHVRPLELSAVAAGGVSKGQRAQGRAVAQGAGGELEAASADPGGAAEGLGEAGSGALGGLGGSVTGPQTAGERRLARGFGGEGEGGGGGAEKVAAAAFPGVRAAGEGAGLNEKLAPLELKPASAGLLPDRNYLVTQGAMLDCVLETKLDSTVPGMTSCHLTRDIYSTNGRVVLLDRGSKVVGHYQAGVQQGLNRIFVVWTRVETPNGVVVELDSPGTGALGEAGVGGWVDTHFWQRFGAAILLSIIQDGADAAAARAAGPQNAGVTFTNQAGASKEVVAKSMEPTLNVPPTLVVNQGERLGIFVARDLDFRSVYGVTRVARVEP